MAVTPPARAAVLVHRAGLTPDLDTALDLDVGSCARLALRAHRAAFGPRLQGVVACGSCGVRLELEIELPDAEVTAPETITSRRVEPSHTGPERVAPDTDGPGAEPPGGTDGSSVRTGAFVVRAPSLRDLAEVAGVAPADACTTLISRCVRYADGAAVRPEKLTPEEVAVVDAVAARLAGLATLAVRTTCTECGEHLRVAIDAGALLWEQVEGAAPLLLSQVATLAAAFGWSEHDVLAMTHARRASYLMQATR